MKPKFHTSKLRNQTYGASLVTVLFVCFSGSSQAVTWDGSDSTDWNNATNWDTNVVPSAAVATISATAPNIATITAAFAAVPNEIQIGRAGLTGRVNHPTGSAANGANQAMVIAGGGAGSVGTYNLADTTTPGAGVSGFAMGTGSMTIGGSPTNNGDLIVGDSATSTGVVNINTSGSLVVTNDLLVGRGNATSSGTMNLENGTVTAGAVGNGCWTAFGRSGGKGSLNMSGGTLKSNGSIYFARDAGSVGTGNLSGGTLEIINEGAFVVAQGAVGVLNQTGGSIQTNNREFWVGQAGGANGTYNLSAGTLNVGSWIAVGRETGTGTVNMTGGTWNKTGTGAFIIGASGPGTMLQSAGLVDVQAGDTWMGENGTCNFTLSNTGEFRSTYFQVARNGSSVGNVNLNGGTLRANQIVGGSGVENVSFNGTQIIAKQAQANFIGGMDAGGATIDSGGLLVDSAGFSITAPQSFDGTGGVVKSGAGTLTLSGANSYTGSNTVNAGSLAIGNPGSGNNTVNAGSLILTAAGAATGDIAIANGATLDLTAPVASGKIISTAVTLGTSATTTLNLNLGNVFGTNPMNSILEVTGALAVNGAVTVNVAGSKFTVGEIPLVSYNAASLSGAGSFALGTLPNGVVATLEVNPNYFGTGLGAVYLDITSVALPEWDGTNEVLLLATGDTVTASADVIVTNAAGIVIGQAVRGAGIPDGTTVTNITGFTITLSQAATATTTGADIEFVTTPGTNEGIWDTVTQNWIDQVSALSSVYSDPNPALFSDLATGPTAVVLNSTVNPSEVVFDNSVLTYSLSGTGKISGGSGLTKTGTAGLMVSNTNDYLGVTTLAGGTTTVGALSNGGVPSSLGAATAASSNLVLAGGTLDYTGAAVSIDRGFTITGASALAIANDVTISGQILRTGGGLAKTGAGILTLNNAGPNGLGDLVVNGGGLVLDGTGGPQTSTAANVDVATSAGSSSLILSGNSVLTTPNRILSGVNAAGTNGTIEVAGTSQIVMNGGWLSVGQTGNGVLTVKEGGSLSMTGSDLNITDLDNSTATLNLQDSGTITTAGYTFWGKATGTVATINISGGTFTTGAEHYVASGAGSSATVTQTGGTVNMNGGFNPIGRNGSATWNQNAGTVNSNGWSIVGRDGTGSGTLNISGGAFNQVQADRPLMIGEFGSGTLNVSGSGQVNSAGATGLILANEPSGTGTVNLNGGTLTVRRVREGNDGNAGVGGLSTFNFNGGTLVAGAGANANFMSGLNSAVISAGGAFIDTNAQTIAIAQTLDDDGGDLTKLGAGTLLLNGANGYFGTTTVAAGTLGGTGSLTGPLVVNASASVNPGASAGTFTVGDAVTINGTYVCEVDGAVADQLAVSGALTIGAAAALDFSALSAPTAASYVIATFTSRTGTFVEQNVPAGYEVVYNTNNLSLVQTATPYTTWASNYGLNPLTDGAPAADKDSDGQSNAIEFALGGSPISGSDNARIYNLVADSDDVGSANEMLMTIAVRIGTPAFAGSPSPTATMEGATYTVQGSATLSSFTAGVTAVTAVTGGLPAAPAGYEYRTFSLDASDGTPSKGFLRVQVNF